jgi:hypothetical protein
VSNGSDDVARICWQVDLECQRGEAIAKKCVDVEPHGTVSAPIHGDDFVGRCDRILDTNVRGVVASPL